VKNDLDILLSEGFRLAVEANLGRDPLRIALDGRVEHAGLVASQVKYLDRARTKLPSWWAARCVLPGRAFEQASSEAAAGRLGGLSGRVALDLTCGLGVDSLALSRRFERVVALERDGNLAAVARENFRRLGVRNIEVVTVSAEDFLAGVGAGTGSGAASLSEFDLVYADPDRRDADGRKMVRLEDSSPDVVGLLPTIRRIAPRLVVKLSPLFDVDEVFRIFGSGVRTEVVSEGGECKQIVADVGFGFDGGSGGSIRAVALGLGEYETSEPPPPPALARSFEPGKYRWLVIPDVALQKARLARRYLTERGVWIESDNGYGFAAEPPLADTLGRAVEIERVEPFDPKALKRRLRAGDIRSIDILRRDVPLSPADLARTLGIRPGGAVAIAFTRASGRLWQITLR
jgi:16S rRNA G966 N2-methylase RsmD